MTLASGSRSQLSIVAEEVFNVTPDTPQMALLPMHSTTLDYTTTTYKDPTILGDRMEIDEMHGNITVGGNIVSTLSHHQHDILLQAGTGGTWASNVLKAGIVTRSFTIQQAFFDVMQFRYFTGCRVNDIDIAINPGQIVSITYTILGAGMTVGQVPLDETPTAALDVRGFSHVGGSITIAGSPVTCTAGTLKISNQMTSAWQIGSNTAKDVIWAEGQVTGSCTIYFEDLVQYNRFLTESVQPVVFTVADGTNTMIITVPRAKFQTGQLPVPNSQVLFLTLSFTGLKDPVTNTTIQFARSS